MASKSGQSSEPRRQQVGRFIVGDPIPVNAEAREKIESMLREARPDIDENAVKRAISDVERANSFYVAFIKSFIPAAQVREKMKTVCKLMEKLGPALREISDLQTSAGAVLTDGLSASDWDDTYDFLRALPDKLEVTTFRLRSLLEETKQRPGAGRPPLGSIGEQLVLDLRDAWVEATGKASRSLLSGRRLDLAVRRTPEVIERSLTLFGRFVMAAISPLRESHFALTPQSLDRALRRALGRQKSTSK